MLVKLNNKSAMIGNFEVSYPYKVNHYMGGGSVLELESSPTISVAFAFDDREALPLFLVDDIRMPVLGLTIHLSANSDYHQMLIPGAQLKLDLCYDDKGSQ
jgi:hypothetical protein